MSGTSLDGLDMAYCHFWQANEQWFFEIRQTTTINYPKTLFQQLKDAITLSVEEHQLLHDNYGTWLGQQVLEFIDHKGIEVDFIASHGHTSHHQPEQGITFQLGKGQNLANVSGKKVICDFRTEDVGKGGQGAPLVPIGDKLLFAEYDYCLNLGGISNISFDKNGERIAFDIGMANMPLNYLMQTIGEAYDKDGLLASKGTRIPALYDKLNTLEYYKKDYPKSTGVEWFLEEVAPLLNLERYALEDVLHTLVHHNCEQIKQVFKSRIYRIAKPKLLVTGGGALNSFLHASAST